MENASGDDAPIRDLMSELGGGVRAESGPKEGPSASERRRAPRVHVKLPVTVRVLIEEQTFSPLAFEGVCENLSRSGALTMVPDLSSETCQLLIQRPRYVRLLLKSSERMKALNLFGKLVWFDRKKTPPYSVCKLGINFEPMTDEAVADLEEYLEAASKKTGPTA